MLRINVVRLSVKEVSPRLCIIKIHLTLTGLTRGIIVVYTVAIVIPLKRQRSMELKYIDAFQSDRSPRES